jgi:oligoribonuclease NrnB/cAMP/cGMP phosphodiesterase (DHH superfamily)
MKVESTIQPLVFYNISVIGSNAIVNLIENVVKKVKENAGDADIWEWDEYTLAVKYRDNLEESISSNFDKWLIAAKNQAYNHAANEIRKKRDILLKNSDEKMCLDRLNLSIPSSINAATMLTVIKDFFNGLRNATSGNWATYRQALRDIPQQSDFPFNVIFPTPPED